VNDAEAAIAHALYGESTPAATRPTADTPDAAIAQALYGEQPAVQDTSNVPSEVRSLRDGDGMRSFYSSQGVFQQALPDDAVPGADIVAWREVAADLGAQPDDASMFASLVRINLEEPADESAVASWRSESERLIKDKRYSQHDLDGARQLVARDPRVFALLERTGLGEHPRVVDSFIQLARKARLRGQL
jgi:hypothetical protein